jgi:four helix bundle protein
MSKNGFKDLNVWQKAMEVAKEIYKITENDSFHIDFHLKNQLRRSAISIPSNIAEGDERDTDKESIRFFFIPKGSLAELRTQLQLSFEIGYITKNIFEAIDKECNHLGNRIGKLIYARKGV